MNSLTRIMSYDKTKNVNQKCDCVKCKINVKTVKHSSLTEDEIERIIKEKYNYKDEKTKKFIRKALQKHGDKYDYSNTVYIKAIEKVEIICYVKGHKSFLQTPHKHLNGQGCPDCSGTKKLTTKEFIKRAREIHGNTYDYSKSIYENMNSKIIIICHNHDKPYEFLQRPHDHLNGNGCPYCNGSKKLTTKEFIEKARKIHGDKYDYSKVNYINNHTKVTIICPKHGEFKQTPNNHLNEDNCPLCANENLANKLRMTKEEFIEKARKIHENKYNYSKINYTSNCIKVTIICPKHGEFKQTPNSHLQGHECPICGYENVVKNNTLSSKEFIKRAIEIQGLGKYDYSKSEYINAKTRIKIICYKHGEFWQFPFTHLYGCGCPKCNNYTGEIAVRKFLTKYNIEYIEQKKFDDCKDKGLLKFDFYIPKYNLCIEYDGIQHFNPTAFKKATIEEKLKNFKYVQKHDQIKNEYCKNNNINLLRIRYDENVEEKLLEYFQNNRIIKEQTIFDLVS